MVDTPIDGTGDVGGTYGTYGSRDPGERLGDEYVSRSNKIPMRENSPTLWKQVTDAFRTFGNWIWKLVTPNPAKVEARIRKDICRAVDAIGEELKSGLITQKTVDNCLSMAKYAHKLDREAPMTALHDVVILYVKHMDQLQFPVFKMTKFTDVWNQAQQILNNNREETLTFAQKTKSGPFTAKGMDPTAIAKSFDRQDEDVLAVMKILRLAVQDRSL